MIAVDECSYLDKLERWWNLDKAGFNSDAKGTRKEYQQTTAEKGETVTVLPSVDAAGPQGPCVIIFN
jgi:hypothetical protein